jgi:osmotically-inducible protein OsmY
MVLEEICIVGLVVFFTTVSAYGTATNKSEADNSAVNQRDSAATEVTADQQGTGTSDLEVTRRIRQQIMSQKDFSIYAQNVKVIATHGFVTLKGPVRSHYEVATIGKLAAQVAGATNIRNELQIAGEE